MQRNRGLCSFDGREWRAIAAADPNASGVIWSCVGTDGAVLVRFDRGWPLLADAAGDVWFASGTKTPGMVDELIVWRDGAVKARVPFQAREEGLRLFAAGPGRVLAWTYLGLRLVTAQGEPEAGGYEVGPVMSVRSRGTPPLTMEPLLSLPIALVEDQVMIVAEPGLRDDNRCRLFITDLPAR